jgi:decaprenylphospho-beta-D-ribofuranose 2-oxidase
VGDAPQVELVSFDGGVRLTQEVARPDRYRQLEAVDPRRRRIVRGGGYSYAAAGFGGGALVQDGRAFDRVLAFDPATGLLECEGGTTLLRIHEVAHAAGFYLPVQPGYPLITVAGCVAADVHGKNQYSDGTFRRVVTHVRLFHPRHGSLRLDAAARPDLLDLTCGGLGLTGHILSVGLRLTRLPGRKVRVTRMAIPRFEDTAAALEDQAPRATFIYTWHDLTRGGDGFGRGHLYAGSFVPEAEGRDDAGFLPVDADSRGRLRFQWLNRATTAPFNRAYAALQGMQRTHTEMGLFSFLFPVARKVAYFELFGRRGFHEYQVLVPRPAFAEWTRALRTHVENEHPPVTLASCKLFRGTTGHVRFDGDGVCVALDFPRGDAGARFAVFLDDLSRALKTPMNLVKDSRLPRAVMEAGHPGCEAFRAALRRFDPDRLYVSELSERLGL